MRESEAQRKKREQEEYEARQRQQTKAYDGGLYPDLPSREEPKFEPDPAMVALEKKLGRKLTPDEMMYPSMVEECERKRKEEERNRVPSPDEVLHNQKMEYYSRIFKRKLTTPEVLYPDHIQKDDYGNPIKPFAVWIAEQKNSRQQAAPAQRKSAIQPIQQNTVYSQTANVARNANPNPNRNQNAGGNTPSPVQAPSTKATTSGKNKLPILGTEHLRIHYSLNPEGRLSGKEERSGYFTDRYSYKYDPEGHLTQVILNNKLSEEYVYNEIGQRIIQLYPEKSAYDEELKYNPRGQLMRMGDFEWEYDEYGATSAKIDTALNAVTQYFYDGDTRLDRVILPNGDEITYAYRQGEWLDAQNPIKKFRNGKLVLDLNWKDALRLASCCDYEKDLTISFRYKGDELSPYKIRFTQTSTREQKVFLCSCDQVGSLKLLTTEDGKTIKRIRFDSFGNVMFDSKPEVHIPIGFAGGLLDQDTGLVRFGYRDYSPGTGRFLCLDPLGDTGGDHDLYDYCVDDPVNMLDNSGLVPLLIPLAIMGVKAAGFGIGATGMLGTSYVFDKVTGANATEGVAGALPKAAEISKSVAIMMTKKYGPKPLYPVWDFIDDKTSSQWGKDSKQQLQDGYNKFIDKGSEKLTNTFNETAETVKNKYNEFTGERKPFKRNVTR